MSLLIAGAPPSSAAMMGFEATVDGESTGEGFGDLLAQLFAAPTESLPAAAGVLPAGAEQLTETTGEDELAQEESALLESMFTSPYPTITPVVTPPTEAQSDAAGTPGDDQFEIAVLPILQAAEASANQEQPPTEAPAQDAPPTNAADQTVAAASAQEQALEPGMESASDAVPLPDEREAKPGEFSTASSQADTEAQQSVARPVGNANGSNGNGNNEGNPEKGRPQFASNVVAAAHNASQTGGSAVAEAAQAAGAEPEPQLMAPEHVVEAVIERAEAGGGEVNIRLDPPELGEVTIRVITDGDSVRVHIQAERPEAAQLLRNAAGALESLLSERGLDLSDVFVGAEQRGSQERFGGQSEAGEEESETSFSALLSAPPGAEVRQHNRIRSAYNPDGALLYRV